MRPLCDSPAFQFEERDNLFKGSALYGVGFYFSKGWNWSGFISPNLGKPVFLSRSI